MKDKYYEIDEAFRKRAKNSNLAVISILLVYTLEARFEGINIFGQSFLKFGSPENVEIWLWIFLLFYAFRYIQSYFLLKKENNLLFMDRSKKRSFEKLFYPKTFKKAFVNGVLTDGEFNFYRVAETKNRNTNKKYYFIHGYVIGKSVTRTDFNVPISNFRYWFVRILIFFPSIIYYLITDPDYLTAHLPLTLYIILGGYFLISWC